VKKGRGLWAERSHFRLSMPSGDVLDTAARPLLMGILNVTPDSFSDGGDFLTHSRAIEHAHKMVRQGADIIDVGGESTRPGSAAISVEQEKERVIPVVKELAAEIAVPISIDTRKAEVAKSALDVGAQLINDVSALRYDDEMASVAASSGVPVCLMHMQGEPETMQASPEYGDVVRDIIEWLRRRVEAAVSAGIEAENLIIDPGFGFGKLVEHNLEILHRLPEFHAVGCPLLIGTSRKSTIGEVVNRPAKDRLYGTLATLTSSVLSGAHILRVHNVESAMDTIKMAEAILRGKEWEK